MGYLWRRIFFAAFAGVVALTFAEVVESADRIHDCTQAGFVPEPPLQVRTTSRLNQMTESRFDSILNRVESIYAPIVAQRGATLVFQKLWSNSIVNAFAERVGSEWRVRIYGGIARHEVITEDALALIACHEIGHHLGGAPHLRRQWASLEGQADYFSTLKCLREVFKDDDNRAIVQAMNPPLELVRSCEQAFGDADSISICIRSTMAGLSAAELMRVLTHASPISLSTPDSQKVVQTLESLPVAQCRLDTFFSGSICSVGHREDVSEVDPTVGVCSSERGFQSGLRPRCWYSSEL